MVRLPMVIASAKAVVTLGSLSLLAQVSPTIGGPVVGSATQWTLDGALVVAVTCLVRAVVALFRINAQDRAAAAVIAKVKDDQILTMATRLTEALTLSNQTMQAVHSSIASNSASIQELKQELLREDHGGPRQRSRP